MKKIIIAGVSVILLVSCGTEVENISNNENITPVSNIVVNSEDRNAEIVNLQPEYKAELYGKVKSIEGNMFTISEIDRSKDPTINMEQTEKRAYMQSLSEADRMALKEIISKSIIGDIKVMIPVGIPMVKKELVGEEKQDIEATLADLKSGDIISVWYNKEITDRKIAKYIKRSIRK